MTPRSPSGHPEVRRRFADCRHEPSDCITPPHSWGHSKGGFHPIPAAANAALGRCRAAELLGTDARRAAHPACRPAGRRRIAGIDVDQSPGRSGVAGMDLEPAGTDAAAGRAGRPWRGGVDAPVTGLVGHFGGHAAHSGTGHAQLSGRVSGASQSSGPGLPARPAGGHAHVVERLSPAAAVGHGDAADRRSAWRPLGAAGAGANGSARHPLAPAADLALAGGGHRIPDSRQP